MWIFMLSWGYSKFKVPPFKYNRVSCICDESMGSEGWGLPRGLVLFDCYNIVYVIVLFLFRLRKFKRQYSSTAPNQLDHPRPYQCLQGHAQRRTLNQVPPRLCSKLNLSQELEDNKSRSATNTTFMTTDSFPISSADDESYVRKKI